MKITLEQVWVDFPIRDLCVFESALAHEKKNIGVRAFCKRYEGLIEEFRKDLSHVEFCFLLAYLEYHDPKFRYDKSVKLDKYILDTFDMCMLHNEAPEEIEWDLIWDKAIPQFRERGILLRETSEAVGYDPALDDKME